jgi:hypothetical protein
MGGYSLGNKSRYSDRANGIQKRNRRSRLRRRRLLQRYILRVVLIFERMRIFSVFVLRNDKKTCFVDKHKTKNDENEKRFFKGR